jgi:hypothetical protein
LSKVKKFGVAIAMTAVAAVPLGFSGVSGAQDAGDCGEGGTSAEESQLNLGGLLGAVAPVLTQTVTPANAPVSSPNAQNCNENEVEIGSGGGGGGGGGGHQGGQGGASPAAPIQASPRFAG